VDGQVSENVTNIAGERNSILLLEARTVRCVQLQKLCDGGENLEGGNERSQSPFLSFQVRLDLVDRR
jgi:hypothetical protein